LIDQGTIALDPIVAQVDPSCCAGCGQCVASCPYNALALVSDVVDVNEYLCKGCGTCAATCPNKALTLIHFNDQQLINEIIGALTYVPDLIM
jgi:heterodisulfide reductase subunit A